MRNEITWNWAKINILFTLIIVSVKTFSNTKQSNLKSTDLNALRLRLGWLIIDTLHNRLERNEMSEDEYRSV